MPGILYLVATPIGNLGDITHRALETLRCVDFIAAEDTRVTRKLLTHFDIKKPLVSYYAHNTVDSGEKIVSRLSGGESCALVTDAGMPAISDPGELLVAMCAHMGIEVFAIPGACAAVSALAISGLPTGRFTFEGFLSTAAKSRREHIAELINEKRTMIFYEAPHKLLRTLRDLLSAFGDRRLSISREMTKLHEETLRCTLSEAIAHFETVPPRGEFVLAVEGSTAASPSAGDNQDDVTAAVALALLYKDSGLPSKEAAKRTSDETGVPKNLIYKGIIEKQAIS